MEFIVNQHHWFVLRIKSVNSCKVLRTVSGMWGDNPVPTSYNVYLATLNSSIPFVHYPKKQTNKTNEKELNDQDFRYLLG